MTSYTVPREQWEEVMAVLVSLKELGVANIGGGHGGGKSGGEARPVVAVKVVDEEKASGMVVVGEVVGGEKVLVGGIGDSVEEVVSEKSGVGCGCQELAGRVSEVAVPLVDASSGSSDSGTSVSSWSDEMNSIDCADIGGVGVLGKVEKVGVVAAPVQMPGVRTYSQVVKSVKFGGSADVVGEKEKVVDVKGGFFKEHIRVPRVKALANLLLVQAQVKLPRQAWEELALASYSVGVVPAVFQNGQVRLRGLMSVGDAAMTSLMVDELYASGGTASSVQNVRSSVLSNAFMSRSFVASGLKDYVVVSAGVDAELSKVGADAVEAVAGVIHRWREPTALLRYMRWMQFLH